MLNYKLILPLSIITFLVACENTNTFSKNTAVTQNSEPLVKDVMEIKYIDEGAVVPNPRIRDISIVLKDSVNALLSYWQYSNNTVDTSKTNIPIPKDKIEEIYDNLVKLSDIPDGMEINPGKVPCVGHKSINVAIIFNTGDTSRFKINGGALCDADVIPEWKMIDSITNVLYSQVGVKQ